MDSAVVEIADVPESAVGDAVVTSVHKKEITHEIFENNSGIEQKFSQFLVDVDNSSFLEQSYRAERLTKYARLVPVTELVLDEHDEKYGTNFLERFWKCRTMCWHILDPDTGFISKQSNSCRGRWCPPCGEARVNVIAHNCREFFEKQKDVRLLTLTFKHKDSPFGEQVKLDKKIFAKFRNRKGWKKYVTGCVYFLHTKWNKEKGEHHIHFHILLTGLYWPQKLLKAEWLKVTGDSDIVFIQPVNSEKGLAKSIKDWSRYAGCPANLLKYPPERWLELVHALEGVRVCGATGICKAVSLSPPKYKQGDSKKINLGRDSTIKRRAAAGDFDALRILFCSGKEISFKTAPSFRSDDDFIDNSAGNLSPVEPLPPDLFSANERSPPGAGACHYEGDESAENAPW